MKWPNDKLLKLYWADLSQISYRNKPWRLAFYHCGKHDLVIIKDLTQDTILQNNPDLSIKDIESS